jgi:Fe-Mn family superoxide dismutase
VKNTNALARSMAELSRAGRSGTPDYAEAKRRFGWEFNGMRLHELYFEHLSAKPGSMDPDGPLLKRLKARFGSVESWQKDFAATGAMRGIGWAITCYDPAGDELHNIWVNEHDTGHLCGALPLVVLDVFEHAYALDYGLKKDGYIKAFFGRLDWRAVERRFAVPRGAGREAA